MLTNYVRYGHHSLSIGEDLLYVKTLVLKGQYAKTLVLKGHYAKSLVLKGQYAETCIKGTVSGGAHFCQWVINR